MMMIIGLVKYRVKRVDKCYIVRYDDNLNLGGCDLMEMIPRPEEMQVRILSATVRQMNAEMKSL